MAKYFQPVQIAEDFLRRFVKLDGIYIDATCGRGNDTVFLSEFVHDKGEVIALDIQEEAILSTRELILSKGINKNINIYLDSHVNIDKYADNNSVDCIMYNLGWLPKGCHDLITNYETTISSINKGLALLNQGGIISIVIYYGKDLGYEEKESLLNYLETIDNSFTVLKQEFLNRKNDPPINMFIIKE